MDASVSAATLTVLLALTSALSWGTGDFCGGLASRQGRAFSVVMVAEFTGALLHPLFQFNGVALHLMVQSGVFNSNGNPGGGALQNLQVTLTKSTGLLVHGLENADDFAADLQGDGDERTAVYPHATNLFNHILQQ